jgi:hypothetical protein
MNLKTIIQANSLKFNHINFYFCQQIIIMKFSKLLIQWYLQNKRDLPMKYYNPYQFGSQKSCYNKPVLLRERLFFLSF